MSIVTGYQNSRWRKSIGNVTYRMVRGRIISSEKVSEKPLTRTDSTPAGQKLLSERQMVFGLLTRFAKLHAYDIKVSFDETKYGSARNYFFKVNYDSMAAAFADLYGNIGLNDTDTFAISDTELEQAVTTYATSNPTSIYRVRKSGATTAYLTDAWSSEQNPDGSTDPDGGGGSTGGSGEDGSGGGAGGLD